MTSHDRLIQPWTEHTNGQQAHLTNGTREQPSRDYFRSLFGEIGIDVDFLPDALLDRYQRLHAKTETVRDGLQSIVYADRLAAAELEGGALDGLTPNEWDEVKHAILYTDIGKTGPLGATEMQEQVITEIYGIDRITDPEKTTLGDFLEAFFPSDANQRREVLRDLGLSVDMSMRRFYSLHAGWSLELLRGAGAPNNLMMTAVAHHLLEGVNPENIVSADGVFTAPDMNRPLDEREVYVILLDKYDAARRRGAKTHTNAIEWIRTNRFHNNPHFHKLPAWLQELFEQCLVKVDALEMTVGQEA